MAWFFTYDMEGFFTKFMEKFMKHGEIHLVCARFSQSYWMDLHGIFFAGTLGMCPGPKGVFWRFML
jgi:exonuclease V gamma subunit